MIIDPKLINFNNFLNGGEEFAKFYVANLLSQRIIQDKTSFVEADYRRVDDSTSNPQFNANTVVSQNWFYGTLASGKKVANHTYTISSYSDNTLLRKIGEITFGANLSDHGQNGIILEGEGFEEALNAQTFAVQSANGIYSKIHKVLLVNFVLFDINQFVFVKYY
jgi:hypothetical protein